MKRAIAGAMLALVLALPASAHHVETADAPSDADALAVYVREYLAQKTPLREMVLQHSASPSPSSLAGVRDAIEVTLQHMESLDTRECFQTVVLLVDAEFGALATAFVVGIEPDAYSAALEEAGAAASGMVNAIASSVVNCAPEAVA